MKRRDFIKNSGALIGGFSLRPYTSPFVRALAANDITNKVLVLVQLGGGNDGLNTVIPIENYLNYYNARPNIAIGESSILSLTDKTGLHPSMSAMRNLYFEGKLAIVQSVGYPNPNYSHFRSTDIWMSASNSEESVPSGFAGRYLSEKYPDFPFGFPNSDMPDPLAIQIGYNSSLFLQGPATGMGVCINNPDYFYDLLNGVEEAVPDTKWGDELKYVRLISRQTEQYGTVMKEAAGRVSSQGSYPSFDLAGQLKIVARLIKGGLKTRVYVVGANGFDTHANQLSTHAYLLQGVSESIKAFMDDLEGMGIDDRVVGMTFSEFGRRIKSNFSNGTDHGAASPLFVFGKNVNGGLIGSNPVIPVNATVYDNIPFQFDFRSVYASLLSQLFCVNGNELETVMLRNFQPIPLIANSSCLVTLPLNEEARVGYKHEMEEKILSNFPNPFTGTTKISFTTKGGHTLLQVMDTMGKQIKILTDKMYSPGVINIDFDSSGFAPGVYYARIQNDFNSQVRAMLKVK